MKLEIITYEQDRLRFFKEQLAHAERRLKWAVKNSDDHNLLSERGCEVGFYQWAVEMAERECKIGYTADMVEVVRCMCCKHNGICFRNVNRKLGNGFCSDGERKDDGTNSMDG